MAATATQDDDLIIFNDEAEEETSSNEKNTGEESSSDESSAQDDTSAATGDDDSEETNEAEEVNETGDLISFEEVKENTEEESSSDESSTQDDTSAATGDDDSEESNEAEETNNSEDVSESLLDLSSIKDEAPQADETEETESQESNDDIIDFWNSEEADTSTNEETSETEVVEEETNIDLNLEEIIESPADTSDEAPVEEANTDQASGDDSQAWDNDDTKEVEQNISLEEISTTPDNVKEELIDIQDKQETVSFDDVGIDLDKLWDSNAENLEWIDIQVEAPVEELAIPEEVVEVPSIEEELGSIEDFAAGFADSDIDESTLIWILDATILKLTKREETATEEIKLRKEEETELKWEISDLRKEERAKKAEIKKLEAERQKTIQTRESIEKMKAA